MSRHHAWLHGELPSWQAEGLISAEQAATLRQRYPAGLGTSSARLLLAALGAVALGFGVILHFAYNWAEMSKWTKLAIIFGGLVLSHGGGLVLAKIRPGSRVATQTLHLFGTMIFGAGIWLISQIYHFDSPYPDAFLAWALGALALAWALPSIPQGALALALLGAWSTVDFTGSLQLANVFAPGLMLVGVLPLAYWRRSKTLLFLGSGAFLCFLALELGPSLEQWTLYPLFFLAVTSLGIGTLGRAGGRPELGASALAGHLVYLALLLFFSYREALDPYLGHLPETPLQRVLFGVTLALAVASMLAAALRTRQRLNRPSLQTFPQIFLQTVEGWQLIMPLVATLLVAALPALAGEAIAYALTTAFSLILIAHGVLVIVQGSQRQSWWLTLLGCSLVVLVAGIRYFDLFESLLARSLGFVLLGAGLVAVSALYKRYEPTTEVHHV